MQSTGVNGSHFHLSPLLGTGYEYYTKISPERKKWPQLKNASILPWTDNYDTISQKFSGKELVLYTWMADNELKKELKSFNKYAYQDTVIHLSGCELYIYRSKQ